MANYDYERLTGADVSFLLFESPDAPMHLSWTWIFAGGSLTAPDGGVDIKRIRQHVAARLFHFPRFRQRLDYTPLERHPIWVDDPSFKLHYHVRHASLPEPGDEARLQIASSSIVSQPLDRSKPLWELWVVEGLTGGRFAVVSKTHHCMVDGIATVDLMNGVLNDAPAAEPEEPGDWIPRPAPPRARLLADTVVDRIRLAAALGRDVTEATMRLAGRPAPLAGVLDGSRDIARAAWSRAPGSPFNRPIGPHRLVAWRRLGLGEVRAVAGPLGASVHDVVLTAVSGALRRLLIRMGGAPIGLRIVVPVDRDRQRERGMLGNRAAGAIMTLPCDVADPLAQLRVVQAEMARARATADSFVDGLWLRVGEVAGHSALGASIALRRWLYSYNLIVSNIPGPREPRYLLDARLEEAYPLVPLFHRQGLGIGIARYVDGLHVGVTAEWEVLPSLEAFLADLDASFADLVLLARRANKAGRRRRSARQRVRRSA